MNTESIKHIFQSQFDYRSYCNEIVRHIFGCSDINARPELLDTTAEGDQSHYIGRMTDAEGRELGFFYTRVAAGSDVRRKRVGLRKLIAPYVKYDVDAAIAVFDDGRHWRLSYICDMKEGATSAKRFSYVLGDEQGQYNTPVHRLLALETQASHLCLKHIFEAFSVETLSKEFFDEYHRHYDRIVAELERQGNAGAFYHDYVKKMMGRIVFLHFLQKKGWLNGNQYFLSELFFKQPRNRKSDFLEQVLEPLFFGIFNTEAEKRKALFAQRGWDISLLDEWAALPYLNGGLFEEDEVDKLKIKLPALLFEDLFSFLASYNFTVDENDPDDAEIGVDPEMLGKIFESLLEDNKAKGAFYTPKEIVRYMCKESLIAYLSSKVEGGLADAVRQFVEHHELPKELQPCREAIDTALREVKICDPAIGSGAFPMGLLNELWRCREAIEGNSMERVELKKEIIENNVYGVDIEKGAIDIARLRFWLSIVVDAEKPEPLPNFDYKFMQGNSLIESFEGHDLSSMLSEVQRRSNRKASAIQYGMNFGDKETRQNLQLLLKQYFSITDHKKKEEYRRLIDDTVKAYILQQGLPYATEQRLQTICTYANQDFFLWHTWFKDIFDKGGFDIVIGNPPYIQLQANGGALGSLYQNNRFETFARTGDIYSLFYEQGWQLLSNGGHLCFITSNKWMRAGYGENTRKFFATKTNPQILIDLGANVFENATVDTNILLYAKEKNAGQTICATLNGANCLDKLSDFVQQQHSVNAFSNSDSWVILSDIEQSIKRKIEAVGTPLKDWDINIYRGVLTGCNEAFIISTEKRNEILANCGSEDERKRTAELIRPILRGRDIKRYRYEYADLYLIATFPSRHYDIEQYPAVKNYLLSFGMERLEQTGMEHIVNGKKVKARKKTNNKWFEVQDSISYWDDFSKPKIVWKRVGSILRFSYDEKGCYVLDSTCFASGTHIKYLVAILNTKMGNYLLKDAPKTGTGDLLISVQAVEPIRIPFPNEDDEEMICRYMERMLLSEDETSKNVVNYKVYEMYGLSKEEIEFIESQ